MSLGRHGAHGFSLLGQADGLDGAVARLSCLGSQARHPAVGCPNHNPQGRALASRRGGFAAKKDGEVVERNELQLALHEHLGRWWGTGRVPRGEGRRTEQDSRPERRGYQA